MSESLHLPVAPVSLVGRQTRTFVSEEVCESLSSQSTHSIHPLGICIKATHSKYTQHVNVVVVFFLNRI